MRRTHSSAETRRRYPLLMQLSLTLSLTIVVLAFALPFRMGDGQLNLVMADHEVVKVEDIDQTQQTEPPPPPPSAPPPVAVADDILIDPVDIDLDIDLDLQATVTVPPPPPPASRAPEPVSQAEEPEVFIAVEQMPELIGGLEAVQRLIRYPEMARRAGIEGVVYVQFVIDEEGRVINPVVLRGIGGGCDEAAVAAVLQVRFRPGMQRGRAVRVQYAIPVRFSLRDAA